METNLYEKVQNVLSTFSEPATIEELTAELVMGGHCDLGAIPLRVVYNFIEDAIRTGGDSCPILKVVFGFNRPGYILKDKDPDILLDCPPEKTVAQKNSEGTSGIVTCYGYGWEREKVYWCRRPALLGYQYVTPVDFCEQVGIYVLQAEDGKVKFVGCTTDRSLGESLYEHTVDELENDWDKFGFFGFRPMADDGILGQLPENVKMLDTLPSIGKIIMEIDTPSSNPLQLDYHVPLRFNQVGILM
jgi:hypothetical protein